MQEVQIHPQLLADCHDLGRLPACAVLLHRNAVLPWFIMVPDTALNDVLDLPREHRDAVITDCAAVSTFIKAVLGYDKVNFAGLGNVVPQMHLHVIGRSEGDPAWPQPVWGALQDTATYTSQQLDDIRQGLGKMAGLTVGGSE